MNLDGLSLTELQNLRREVQAALDKETKRLLASVAVRKEERGHTLTHAEYGTYLVRPEAYKGRLRMWKMVPGKHGPKRGPVVVNESLGLVDDLDSLRVQVALGHYKDR